MFGEPVLHVVHTLAYIDMRYAAIPCLQFVLSIANHCMKFVKSRTVLTMLDSLYG